MLNGYYEGIPVTDAMARIYVWLRYSSTRHLTWQRNYNTQPRILSAAQERLTSTVASTHARVGGERAPGGKGGEGPWGVCVVWGEAGGGGRRIVFWVVGF